jgi:hypothetical protein
VETISWVGRSNVLTPSLLFPVYKLIYKLYISTMTIFRQQHSQMLKDSLCQIYNRQVAHNRAWLSYSLSFFYFCNSNNSLGFGVTERIILKWVWCMCDRASCTKVTRGTTLIQQLWFIVINYLYMFRAPICPSSGEQVVYCCMWCSALVIAAEIPTDINFHTVHKTARRFLGISAATTSAEHHIQQYTTCTPEDGHIFARNM